MPEQGVVHPPRVHADTDRGEAGQGVDTREPLSNGVPQVEDVPAQAVAAPGGQGNRAVTEAGDLRHGDRAAAEGARDDAAG